MLVKFRKWRNRVLQAFKGLLDLIYGHYRPCKRITYHYKMVELQNH